jgi:hypothetical protein
MLSTGATRGPLLQCFPPKSVIGSGGGAGGFGGCGFGGGGFCVTAVSSRDQRPPVERTRPSPRRRRTMSRDEGARSLGQAWTVAPGAFDPTSAGGPQPAPERHRRLRRRQRQPLCLCLPAVSLLPHVPYALSATLATYLAATRHQAGLRAFLGQPAVLSQRQSETFNLPQMCENAVLRHTVSGGADNLCRGYEPSA